MRQRPVRQRTCGNLPAELSSFVGRGAELAEVGRLLEASRLVTVTGVGGVGKSRLALAAAREAAEAASGAVSGATSGPASETGDTAQERYCDGVWLAELSCVRDPALLELTLAESLGLTDHTTRPPRTVLTEHLAERRLLLVLDGFEQLVEETAELVRELLRRSPACGCWLPGGGRWTSGGNGPSRWPRRSPRRPWSCWPSGRRPPIRASP